jgi:hypothetical protein
VAGPSSRAPHRSRARRGRRTCGRLLTAQLAGRSQLGATRLAYLNIFTTLACHPELFKPWLRFGGYLLNGGGLPFATASC